MTKSSCKQIHNFLKKNRSNQRN